MPVNRVGPQPAAGRVRPAFGPFAQKQVRDGHWLSLGRFSQPGIVSLCSRGPLVVAEIAADPSRNKARQASPTCSRSLGPAAVSQRCGILNFSAFARSNCYGARHARHDAYAPHDGLCGLRGTAAAATQDSTRPRSLLPALGPSERRGPQLRSRLRNGTRGEGG